MNKREIDIDKFRSFFLVFTIVVGIIFFLLLSDLDISLTGMASVGINSTPDYVRDKTSFVVSMNGETELNLDGFFRGGELTYMATSSKDVDVEIHVSLLSIIPKANFTGVSSITLIASDGVDAVRQDVNVSVELSVSEIDEEIANSPFVVDREVLDELEIRDIADVVAVMPESELDKLTPKDVFTFSPSEYDYELKNESILATGFSLMLTRRGFDKLKASPDVEGIYYGPTYEEEEELFLLGGGDFEISATTCGTITANTNLTENLESNGTCLTINADDIYIDCRGFGITGSNSGSGINITNRNGVMIKDCELYNFSNGIYLDHANSTQLHNVTSAFSSFGVKLYYSEDNFINYTTIYNNTNRGLQGDYSDNNTIFNSTARTNTNANLWFSDSSYLNISYYKGLNSSNNEGLSIAVHSIGNYVAYSEFKFNDQEQIQAYTNVTGTIFKGNTFECGTDGKGIELKVTSNSNVLQDNSFINCDTYAIQLQNTANNVTITNNNLTTGGSGIVLSIVNDTTVMNNTIKHFTHGIKLGEGVRMAKIKQNMLKECYNWTTGSNQEFPAGIFSDMSYTYNEGGTFENLIFNNTFANNTQGIVVWITSGSMNISKNSFINNTKGALTFVGGKNVYIHDNNYVDNGATELNLFEPVIAKKSILAVSENLTVSKFIPADTTLLMLVDGEKNSDNLSDLFFLTMVNSTGATVAPAGSFVYSPNPGIYGVVQVLKSDIYNITAYPTILYINSTPPGDLGVTFVATNITLSILPSPKAAYPCIRCTNITIANEIFSAKGNATGVYFFNSSGINLTNITISESVDSYFINSLNSTLNNTNLDANVIFRNTNFGSINFTQDINVTATRLLSDFINITYNSAYVKSSSASEFNTTGIITLKNLSYTDAMPVVDFNDDGVFEMCPLTICRGLSNTANNLTFNVTHFTTYSSENVRCGANVTTDISLTRNLNSNGSCFRVGADDITIDCKGFGINGSNTGIGINITNRNRVAVKNCEIYNFSIGVNLDNANLTQLHNVTTAFNVNGTKLWYSKDNLINYSTAYNNTWHGIDIVYSNNNTVLNSTARFNTNVGIYFARSESANLTDSKILNTTANDGLQILYASSGHYVEGNEINYHYDTALILSTGVNDSILKDNTILCNGTGGGNTRGKGFDIKTQSRNNTIMNNVFTNCNKYSIENSNSANNNLIVNNTITDCDKAISLYIINGTIIKNNTITRCAQGIAVGTFAGVRDVQITDNKFLEIYEKDYGMTPSAYTTYLERSAGILIEMKHNYNDGTFGNLIYNNTFANSSRGVMVWARSGSINISNNQFINNTKGAFELVGGNDIYIEDNDYTNNGDSTQEGFFEPVVINATFLASNSRIDILQYIPADTTFLVLVDSPKNQDNIAVYPLMKIYNSTGDRQFAYDIVPFAPEPGAYTALTVSNADVYNISITTAAIGIDATGIGNYAGSFAPTNLTISILPSSKSAYSIMKSSNITIKGETFNAKDNLSGIYLFNNSGVNFTDVNFTDTKNSFIINSLNTSLNNVNLDADVVFTNTEFGSINFTQDINITDSILLSDIVNITSNSAYVKSESATGFNKSATITFKNLTFYNPNILFNLNDNSGFADCSNTICTLLGCSSYNCTFNVTHFTTYTINETVVGEVSRGGSRGSWGASPIGRYGAVLAQPKCLVDLDCEEGKICINSDCVENLENQTSVLEIFQDVLEKYIPSVSESNNPTIKLVKEVSPQIQTPKKDSSKKVYLVFLEILFATLILFFLVLVFSFKYKFEVVKGIKFRSPARKSLVHRKRKSKLSRKKSPITLSPKKIIKKIKPVKIIKPQIKIIKHTVKKHVKRVRKRVRKIKKIKIKKKKLVDHKKKLKKKTLKILKKVLSAQKRESKTIRKWKLRAKHELKVMNLNSLDVFGIEKRIKKFKKHIRRLEKRKKRVKNDKK